MAKWLSFLKTIIQSPVTWLVFTIAIVLFYLFATKTKIPVHLNIIGIFKNYHSVFPQKADLFFLGVVPFTLSVATNIESEVNVETSNLLCVVISILASAVVSFMVMTSDRADAILEKEGAKRNQSDNRVIARNKDCLAIGMFEILLAVFMLILIFLAPIFSSKLLHWGISCAVYFSFYVFLLNLFIMMRKLCQVYLPGKHSNKT